MRPLCPAHHFSQTSVIHELVNITFFDEGASVHDWHEADARLKIVEKLRPMLDKPIDVQVYEIERTVGIAK